MAAALALFTAGTFYAQDHAANAKDAHAAKPNAPEIFCGHMKTDQRPANVASRAVAARVHTSVRAFLKRGTPALLFYTLRAQYDNRAPNCTIRG
jgi:hypothetical protein